MITPNKICALLFAVILLCGCTNKKLGKAEGSLEPEPEQLVISWETGIDYENFADIEYFLNGRSVGSGSNGLSIVHLEIKKLPANSSATIEYEMIAYPDGKDFCEHFPLYFPSEEWSDFEQLLSERELRLLTRLKHQ